MASTDKDLKAVARIRNAALEGFALRGVEATSIRDIASAAGVSSGLIQHHFRTKSGLRDAVDAHVLAIAADAIEAFDLDRPADQLLIEIGDRITEFVRDYPLVLLYVTRSAAAGEESGIRMFGSLLAVIRTQVARLVDEGVLAADVDQLWTAIHLLTINLGVVMLEPAIEAQLEDRFRAPEQLQRWNLATQRLFGEGLMRRD
ncbi:MAG TPA: helix-turn-helix domain-containing protein [Solirubrobacterales bacterium]|nr:helix-turn-helix domain-containing protein [Solirubrobacterales bacterium]